MIKRFTKLLATSLVMIMLLSAMALFLVGCNQSNEPENPDNTEKPPVVDTTPVSSSALGYLEDFGNEVVTNSRVKEGCETLLDKDSSYEGYEEIVAGKIFLSHITAPSGNYTATLGDISLGEIALSEDGEAMLTALPEGLVLGEKYTLTCTNANGKPYTQTVRIVSRAIDDGEELIRALTYYTRKYEKAMGLFDGEYVYDSPAPADTTNPGKFYNGQTFSQRLYVLATSVDISHDLNCYGVDGFGSSATNAFRNPYTNLWSQKYSYWYDELDGQGNSIVVNTFVDQGLFGHIGQGAVLRNFYFNPASTWWNVYSPETKCLLGMSIASGATVENVAMYVGFEVTLGGMNALAPVVTDGAILKDIYIGLSSSVVFEPKTANDPYVSGYMGWDFGPEYVDNVVVVSPYLDNAGWIVVDGERYELGAANDYDEYYVEGLYHFDYVDEALNNGRSLVGSWYIRTDGSVKWKNS